MGDKKVIHVAISIEAKKPKFAPKIEEMRKAIADILKIEPVHVGITATTGEGLTEFGKGNGIFVTAILTCEE